jgi:hypothetical protein
MQVRWINDPVVRRDGILGRGWRAVETRAGSRSQPRESEDASSGGDGLRLTETAKRAKRSRATNGEIFWLLRNGNLPKGMPTWAALPEPMRWRIIACRKSLGPATPSAADTKPN